MAATTAGWSSCGLHACTGRHCRACFGGELRTNRVIQFFIIKILDTMISFLKIGYVSNTLFVTLLAGFFLLAFSSCTKETFSCEGCAEAEASSAVIEMRSDTTNENSSIISDDVINP